MIPDLGALPGLPRPERYGGYAYMAIFDGHDGDACASFLQHELHGHLCRQAQFFGDARAAVARAFREADDEACARLRADDDASGSTAVVALFDGGSNKLLVAHCGDSRAVLSVSGGCALPLTQDHRLTRPDELARIRSAGGLVVNHRLNGSLAVSRSFGDALHRAAKESDIPNFKASYLGRFPLVLADFWTSDHLLERSRSVDAFSGTRARGTLTLKRR